MSITSYSTLYRAYETQGQKIRLEFNKSGNTVSVTGSWWDYWTQVTGVPGAGAVGATTPGTAYTETSYANGAIACPNKSGAKYLIGADVVGNVDIGCIMLYDRLVGVSGVDFATTGNKTINSVALPRYTTGEGVECWVRSSNASAVTFSLSSYTNQAGTTGRAGGSITPLQNSADFIKVPIQAGDSGIKSVEVLNVSVASAPANNVELVLLRPLMYFPLFGVEWIEMMQILESTALVRVYDGATISFATFMNNTTSNRDITGHIMLVHE